MASSGLTSRAVIGDFYQRLEGAFDNSWVPRLAATYNSNQQNEEYPFSSMVAPLRKWGGQRSANRLTTKNIRITNEVWETSLNIPQDDARRDKTGQLQTRAGELAQRAAELFEKQFTTMIIDGDASTSGLAYDGQFFFDTDHSEGSSGTLQNNLDNSDVSQLNVGSATAPTQSEMSEAILGVIAYMYQYKDDQGEPLNGAARQYLVMVPTNLWGPSVGGTRNEMTIGASGAVASNVLKSTGFNIDVAVNPRLDADSTSIFYVFRTDGATRPFILQEEVGIAVKALAEGSEYEFENREHIYTVEWIGGFGFGQWQHAVRATLS